MNRLNNSERLFLKNPFDFMQNIIDTWYNRIKPYIEYSNPFQNCWVLNMHGYKYPHFMISRKNINAHIISYIYHYKIIPNEIVMHLCNQPKCVNPDHLMLGDQKDNMQYARMFHDHYIKKIVKS